MKQSIKQDWHLLFLLALLSVSLQSCLDIGNSSPFQDKSTNKNGGTIKINTSDQAQWKGKIYFTLSRNLYVLDGKTQNLTQLTNNMDVRTQRSPLMANGLPSLTVQRTTRTLTISQPIRQIRRCTP